MCTNTHTFACTHAHTVFCNAVDYWCSLIFTFIQIIYGVISLLEIATDILILQSEKEYANSIVEYVLIIRIIRCSLWFINPTICYLWQILGSFEQLKIILYLPRTRLMDPKRYLGFFPSFVVKINNEWELNDVFLIAKPCV